MLALGTGVEALQAIAYRMFNPLVEAGREMQAVLGGALIGILGMTGTPISSDDRDTESAPSDNFIAPPPDRGF
ncbi:hypothetical protein [Pseudomonas cavernicola]|uniref:hypothetical protein n=1 Tax=Pseudomonas cavernicola TaxID=2320866 RepID=UPI0015AB5D04|nr:hypothetical protein [Pseudomonas cavernicola]